MASKRNSRRLIRLLALPLLCLAAAVAEGFLYAGGPFGVYVDQGAISGAALVRFFSPLAVDYLWLGAALALLARRRWYPTLVCGGLVTLLAAVHFIQYTALQVSGEFVSVMALHFAD